MMITQQTSPHITMTKGLKLKRSATINPSAVNGIIYYPAQKIWYTDQVLPSPTYNLDNQVMFFSLLAKKTRQYSLFIFLMCNG